MVVVFLVEEEIGLGCFVYSDSATGTSVTVGAELETGQIVVEMAIVLVTTSPYGHFVTTGGHDETVETMVV